LAFSFKTWLGTILVLMLLFVGWRMVGSGARPALRSAHSEPAKSLPAERVAIVDAGKTFHRPECKFIHGKSRMVTVEEAVRQGYAPCVRCEKELLSK
jgi:hypothetical protein